MFARLLSVSAVNVLAGVLVMVMWSVTELWLLRQNTKTKSFVTSVNAGLVMEDRVLPLSATNVYATKVGVCSTADAPGPGNGSVGP